MASKQKVSGLSYERIDDVAVWYIDDFEEVSDKHIEAAEDWYESETSARGINASVVVFDDAPSLSSEVQTHINDAWSHLAQLVEIDRAGYVGDGISAMAVKSNIEVSNVEIEDFTDIDEAVAWASQEQ